ncbi:ribosome maturation factor RimM [Amphibacillus sp. MSJ-3]|uniref:ribosome maturation factor RimM n=1 Tax=Amphibacillus sp. MSJ-3 TaxID=2841505 RepID=UPI001C0F3192|nr:ribosome maturation factor RimM [Amphibacillus sp. MSJ-3]MBU5594583.1 ribosome maturation factor RimM [Amphibacillus sp. MSJ-3]
MTQFFNVGKIVNTHGIKGEVKVVRITDFEQRFKQGNQLYLFLKDQKEPIVVKIQSHRKHKQFDMLLFEGLTSINDVEHFKEGILKVSEADLHPLEEGSYYYHEIIGCEVRTTTGESLGSISEILAPGANDVWVVKRKNDKDLLIPYIEPIVKQVNVKDKYVVIEPMEGLLS